MNVDVKTNIHNRFDIWKENVETGKKEQVGYAENIILDYMWTRLCGDYNYFVNIHYGTGTGTLESSRTSLFTHLGTGAASTVETVRAIPTSYWRRSITLGLTTANGNTLTEVGIAADTSSTTLVTHAQIRDMNGNPTGIQKTSVDIITIYATIYVTLINDHASIKLVHPNNNGLLDYLFGAPDPAAVFSAGMSGLLEDWPRGLLSFSLGNSASGSWSADVPNKRRVSSAIRFGTTQGNGNIKELLFDDVARLVLPATGIYGGLELTDVPVGTGDGETTKFTLPSANIDHSSLVVKIDGIAESVTKINSDIVYKTADVTGGYPAGNGYGCSFSPDGTILAVAHVTSPYITMYENIAGTWTKMANVSGGYPSGDGTGCSFSPDGNILAVAHNGSPYITMYENIAGTWTKMADVTGGYPTNTGTGCSFSPDGTILAVAHASSPYITMYENIAGTWTKMADVTGGYPAGNGNGCSFSPDGTILAVAHLTSPYITMYENIAGTWTKMADVTGGYPTNTGTGCSFSPDGTILAVTHNSSPYITMYENIAGVWTKMANVTGGYPSDTGRGCSFSPDGNILAVAHASSPYITMYKDIDGVWTKMANVTGGSPTGIGQGCSFSLDGTILAVAYGSSPYITMYFVNKIMTGIEFTTAPANGAVITADYTVNGIHKTDQRVIDVTATIQFGEPV